MRGWDNKVPNIITNITSSGYVEFDNGMGKMFRPDVETATL